MPRVRFGFVFLALVLGGCLLPAGDAEEEEMTGAALPVPPPRPPLCPGESTYAGTISHTCHYEEARYTVTEESPGECSTARVLAVDPDSGLSDWVTEVRFDCHFRATTTAPFKPTDERDQAEQCPGRSRPAWGCPSFPSSSESITVRRAWTSSWSSPCDREESGCGQEIAGLEAQRTHFRPSVRPSGGTVEVPAICCTPAPVPFGSDPWEESDESDEGDES